jgi:hypothetical protein
MRKRKTPGMTHEKPTPKPKDSERRNDSDRRADDRRAHARFSPHKAARNDRRQGERREPQD